jgi:hypothetical protein
LASCVDTLITPRPKYETRFHSLSHAQVGGRLRIVRRSTDTACSLCGTTFARLFKVTQANRKDTRLINPQKHNYQ